MSHSHILIMFNFTFHVCVEIFHIMNIDVPPGVGAPPLSTQLSSMQLCTNLYESVGLPVELLYYFSSLFHWNSTNVLYTREEFEWSCSINTATIPHKMCTYLHRGHLENDSPVNMRKQKKNLDDSKNEVLSP